MEPEKNTKTTATETTEVFPLLDLPWEMVEQIVGGLNSHALIQLSMCSHQFKELSSMAHYWQKIIQNEKKPIIYVPADITDWKEIFKTAKELPTIAEVHDDSATRTKANPVKYIFAPGNYVIPEGESFILRPYCNYYGLYDMPWSEKTPEQKTIFIKETDPVMTTPFYFYGSAREKEVVIEIKNITVNAGDKTGWPFGCILRQFTFHIDNCEFHSGSLSGLLVREGAHAVVENSNFYDCKQNGIFAVNGALTVRNCVFTGNLAGVEFRECTEDKKSSVESCQFDGNKSGVLTYDCAADITVEKCYFTKCEELAIGCKHFSKIAIKGNEMDKNPIGVIAFENTTVSLEDNIIRRNQYWGVSIRYDVKVEKFTGNTITNNENIGLQMPEQEEPHLSSEYILQNNTIKDNQTNCVFEEKKKADYEMLYTEGDDPSTIARNVDVAIARNLCTFSATNANFSEQNWYECYTCGLCTSSGVCETCVKTSHEGHFISSKPNNSLFYCDCGAGNKCKAMKKK